MQILFQKLKDTIIANGNSNFSKVNLSLSNKMKLETVNTMLLLEEGKTISKITMSFFETHPSGYLAFRIEKRGKLFQITGLKTSGRFVYKPIHNLEEAINIFQSEINLFDVNKTNKIETLM